MGLEGVQVLLEFKGFYYTNFFHILGWCEVTDLLYLYNLASRYVTPPHNFNSLPNKYMTIAQNLSMRHVLTSNVER